MRKLHPTPFGSALAAMAAMAALVCVAVAQPAGADVIFSNNLTANASGFSSGQSANDANHSNAWSAPTVGTPYFQDAIFAASGNTTYAWSTVHITNAASLSNMAGAGFSISADFTVLNPSAAGSGQASFVGFGFLGTSGSFNRFTGDKFFSVAINTLTGFTGTPGSMQIGVQNYAGQGSGGGTIASGVTFNGATQTNGSTYQALSGTYHMAVVGAYDGTGALTISFTVSNLDGSNAATLTSSPIAGAPIPSTANSYYGFKDTAANGGTTDRFNNFVIATVPEPASLALLGVGGLCLWRRRRS